MQPELHWGQNIRIVIPFFSPTCLGQETAKGPFGLRIKLPQHACPPHTVEALHGPFLLLSVEQEAVNAHFYGLWFDPTGNRTPVYSFSTIHSIHSITKLPFLVKLPTQQVAKGDQWGPIMGATFVVTRYPLIEGCENDHFFPGFPVQLGFCGVAFLLHRTSE